MDLGRGIASGKKSGSFKTAEYRVFRAYFRIARLEADDHMNHHCAGTARRHGEALDLTQERVHINGVGVDHHLLEIH
jgi:hypothetical protein